MTNPGIECGVQSLHEMLFQLDHEIERLEDYLAVAKGVRDCVRVLIQAWGEKKEEWVLGFLLG